MLIHNVLFRSLRTKFPCNNQIPILMQVGVHSAGGREPFHCSRGVVLDFFLFSFLIPSRCPGLFARRRVSQERLLTETKHTWLRHRRYRGERWEGGGIEQKWELKALTSASGMQSAIMMYRFIRRGAAATPTSFLYCREVDHF